jgi:hypothetical protein
MQLSYLLTDPLPFPARLPLLHMQYTSRAVRTYRGLGWNMVATRTAERDLPSTIFHSQVRTWPEGRRNISVPAAPKHHFTIFKGNIQKLYREFQKELHSSIPNVTVWRVLGKRLHLKAYRLSIPHLCTTLSVNVFVTHLEYYCEALFETTCINNSKYVRNMVKLVASTAYSRSPGTSLVLATANWYTALANERGVSYTLRRLKTFLLSSISPYQRTYDLLSSALDTFRFVRKVGNVSTSPHGVTTQGIVILI